MPDQPPQHAKPGQPRGKSFIKYTPDGRTLINSGLADFVRTYDTRDGYRELIIDNIIDGSTAIVTGNDYFIAGSEEGVVAQYSLSTKQLDKYLVRSSLPIRDISLSPGAKWVAVASDEVIIKVVNRHDIEEVLVLRDHPKIIKHLSYNSSGQYLAASCIDGIIYLYSMNIDKPDLCRTIEGIIRPLDPDDDATSECVWHPDARAFACATATGDIHVVSAVDGAQQRSFTGGHRSDVLSMAWSGNGALLASSSRDGGLVLWETVHQSMIKRFDFENTMNMTWHPLNENYMNWTTSTGGVYICPDFLEDQDHIALLKGPNTVSPYYHDPRHEKSAAVNGRIPLVHGRPKPLRAGTPDSLDLLLHEDDAVPEDWIEDDDGAGYANASGKRRNRFVDEPNGHQISKRIRRDYWTPQIHEPFQPGSTPWRGNRKYLCLSLIGFVWTLDQDTHHTVTVEFIDRGEHRDFHFTDPYHYDKACLNRKGTLFSCPPGDDHPAMIFYRPHEVWTTRIDWRTPLPAGEEVTAIGLSETHVTILTTSGYVRVYTLFGTPLRIWRQRTGPAVTCAAFNDYVLTVANGPVGPDGCAQLVYSVEDVRTEEVFQSEDVVALPEGGTLKIVFFSEKGDPYIYDSGGNLLVLVHWRQPGQAKWVPVLVTAQLDRLTGGRRSETYWPVAVTQDKFHCIILKGNYPYPSHPAPHLTEFDFKVPIGSHPTESANMVDGSRSLQEKQNSSAQLEESFVRNSILLSLAQDSIAPEMEESHPRISERETRLVGLDKTLLQLLALECREGEERGMKALDIVGLMQDRGARLIEAATKVAARWGRELLVDKIGEMEENRG